MAACLAATILTLPGGPAWSQGLARNSDPQGVLVDELVVRARLPGPAWWKVTYGASTVWVLGVPASLPKGFAWNDRPLQTRLGEARLMLAPPKFHTSPVGDLFYVFGHRKDLKARARLEQSLPAALALRFAAARQGLGRDAGRYAGWKPAVAGAVLDQDFRAAAKTDLSQPLGHILALASKAKIRRTPAADYPARAALTALFDATRTMSDDEQDDCLDDALKEVEAGSARMNRAAQGWAEGDVRESLSLQRGYDRCLAALPEMSSLLQRMQDDEFAAIDKALQTPGNTVAVVELRALLARGGVLDRLRAKGYAIATPGAT